MKKARFELKKLKGKTVSFTGKLFIVRQSKLHVYLLLKPISIAGKEIDHIWIRSTNHKCKNLAKYLNNKYLIKGNFKCFYPENVTFVCGKGKVNSYIRLPRNNEIGFTEDYGLFDVKNIKALTEEERKEKCQDKKQKLLFG